MHSRRRGLQNDAGQGVSLGSAPASQGRAQDRCRECSRLLLSLWTHLLQGAEGWGKVLLASLWLVWHHRTMAQPSWERLRGSAVAAAAGYPSPAPPSMGNIPWA